MKNVMHFKSQKDRLDYLRGGFEEIIPKKVEDAPKGKKKTKKKAAKKGAKKDEV